MSAKLVLAKFRLGHIVTTPNALTQLSEEDILCGIQRHQAGDWGWVERSVLRKDLADVAFSLQPGQTSDVIETPDAVYLMLVEDKKPAHAKVLNDVREDIEKTLRTQEQARLQKKWIDGLKKKTFVLYIQ